MSRRSGVSAALLAALVSAVALSSNDAGACGGCFITGSRTTVVSAHRMAVSISTQRTVLWDQIQYAGSPEDFAWVLPVKPGAYLELANNAFFEALDTATSTTVVAPQVFCNNNDDYPYDGYSPGYSKGCGIGCTAQAGAEYANGAGGGGGAGGGTGHEEPPPVTVLHQESIGPYETVTVHSNVKGALFDWLTSHSYDVPQNIEPVIDSYEADGFDFIALRLTPGNGVQLMQPVRVVSPGAAPTLPLRMVAAGTGANVAVTLFLIGEGRWEPQNFPTSVIDGGVMSWDFDSKSSNYAQLREAVLATNQGRTWLDTFSKQGALLDYVKNPITQGYNTYLTSDNSQSLSTIGELYMAQGAIDDPDVGPLDCIGSLKAASQSKSVVVDPCAGQDPMCTAQAGPGELDARTLECGPLDDIAASLIGLHPADVWLTRLESNLPQSALADDLLLQAAPSQDEIDNWRTATKYTHHPQCGNGSTAAALPPRARPPSNGSSPRRKNEMALYAALLAAAAVTAGRRLLRRPAVAPAKSPRPIG